MASFAASGGPGAATDHKLRRAHCWLPENMEQCQRELLRARKRDHGSLAAAPGRKRQQHPD
jgi:hypothetical protein